MPYVREGRCVYKKKSDGSKGKSMGCSDSEEMAKKHMKALYAAENKSMAEFSMAITKASIPDKASRTMRLSMVTSDTEEDSYEERMSVELFNDFVQRIENSSSVPEPFDGILEDGWNGGMPYPSISHYRSGGGKNVPGEIERVYVDGDRLKANAVLHDTDLGKAVWKSVCTDLEERELPIEERSFENPVRISIGFLDLEHKHEIEDEEDFIFTRAALKQKCEKCEEGINGKVYLKGQLVHLAFTRVPANPRTSVEVMRMGDEINTKKDDAESIIGELADELVGKSKTDADDALVIKREGKDLEEYAWDVRKNFYDEFAPELYVRMVTDKNIVVSEKNQLYRVGYSDNDGEISFDKRSDWEKVQIGIVSMKSEAIEYEWEIKFENDPQIKTEDKSEAKMGEETKVQEEPVVEEEQVVEEKEEEEEVVAPAPEELDELEKSAVSVVAKIKELAANGKYGADALKEVQPLFNQFGETVKKSVAAPVGQVDEDALATKVAEKLMPAIGEMIAKSIAGIKTETPNDNTFASRSLQVVKPAEYNPENQRKLSQIEQIANRTTGLG